MWPRSRARPRADTNPVAEALLLSARTGLVVLGGSAADTIRRTYGCLYGLEPQPSGSSTGAPIVSYAVTVAATLQSLASAVLIFLFLLAVRNLLRLK